MNFPMKMRSQKEQMAFQSCSFSSRNHIQSATFRFVPNFLSLSALQLAVYKRKERKHCHCYCFVPTANAQLLSSSEHSGNCIQQHYVCKVIYITEHSTNLTLNDSNYGTGLFDNLVVANHLRTKRHNTSKNWSAFIFKSKEVEGFTSLGIFSEIFYWALEHTHTHTHTHIYIYRGADNSLARPGRNQATATKL